MPTVNGRTGTESRTDRLIARLPPRLRWATGVVRHSVREPADGLDRAMVRVRRRFAKEQAGEQVLEAEPGWHQRLHRELGLDWPCAAAAEFAQLWPEIERDVRAHGLALGRATYGGWDDADPGFARAIWCLMHHLRSRKVVETGVARGITSRVILEGFERGSTGQLWSIDLPAMDPTLHGEIGIAVPERLRSRWTYIRGTSRQRLPQLLERTAPIDLFVHDSSHTERNTRFELGRAWRAIQHGAVVADDVHRSAGFARFSAGLPPQARYVAQADDGHALFGIALKDV